MENNTTELEKAIAKLQNFIGAAVLTFFLYLIFYIPGLIINILYLLEAKRIEKIAGQKPAGYGCLIALLILGAIPLIISIVFISMMGNIDFDELLKEFR
ncbi:MAG: hypothetical protein AB7G44_11085 [Bacteroidia bacterium]